MKIKFKTSRFGDLEVEDSRVIDFPHGIPGFSSLKRYVLMDYKDTPLKWLQSMDDPHVAFIVASPETVTTGYQVNVDEPARRSLALAREEDLAVLLILRVQTGKVIANLKAPLLLNSALMRGMQILPERL